MHIIQEVDAASETLPPSYENAYRASIQERAGPSGTSHE